VRALRAVDPDGSGVVDLDGVGGDISRAGGDEVESGEETSDIAVLGDRLAWFVEGRLGDGVVSCGELELHHVSYGSSNVVGGVGEGSARGADGDDVDGCGLSRMSMSTYGR
jgi:hypothetical protein